MRNRIASLIIASLLLTSPVRAEEEHINAGVVGWGNLLVPGLGATLRDQPGQGLKEAGIEIGSFYGGTLLAPESRFRIDGSINLPQSGNINSAAIAQNLQQFGLKYHFYNTFIHYQQTAKENADTEREKNNPQPLYQGSTLDMFTAPFRWDNLSSLWVWPVIIAGTTYLTIDYARSSVPKQNLELTPSGQAIYGFNSIALNPVASYMGEEGLFRGFMQREIIGMTSSVPLAMVTQSALFSILHEDRINAFAVGLYLGASTLGNGGNLEKGMAVHFWLNMFDGLFTYFARRRSAGLSAPFSPPISTSLMFEF